MLMYILDDDHTPIAVDDIEAWAHWRATHPYHLAKTELGKLYVSTVFLGIDHNFSGHGPPLLFESMIFTGGSFDDMACERYATWDEAMAGHEKMVERLRELNHVAPIIAH